MKKSRVFDVVLSKGSAERPWVAQTTGDNWYASQGNDPSQALENLEAMLYLTAILLEKEDKRPFIDVKMQAPSDVAARFSESKRYVSSEQCEQGKTYKTSLKISWSKKEAQSWKGSVSQ